LEELVSEGKVVRPAKGRNGGAAGVQGAGPSGGKEEKEDVEKDGTNWRGMLLGEYTPQFSAREEENGGELRMPFNFGVKANTAAQST
jgi:hypothetical protein